MAFRRNFKLYIKERSTIVAAIFFVFFLMISIGSFLPALNYKKGISDNFKRYDITELCTNDYSITYAISNNKLFYSQDKDQTSHLNTFTNTEGLFNEYGSQTIDNYNFIDIGYTFPGKIVSVKGIMDNLIGQDGETFVMLENGELYSISSRSNVVELFAYNIKNFDVKYDNKLNKNVYILLDNNNQLTIKYYENNDFVSTTFLFNYDNFSYVSYNENKYILLASKDNQLYEIIDNNDVLITNSCSKMVGFNNKYYYLDNEHNLFGLTLNNENIFEPNDLSFEADDIYSVGDALILTNNIGTYFLGEIIYFESDGITRLNIPNNLKIYCNTNSVIAIDDKGRLMLYNKDSKSFDYMYSRLITKVIKYLSIFVEIMLVFYFILSFVEDSKRYNRYFKH